MVEQVMIMLGLFSKQPMEDIFLLDRLKALEVVVVISTSSKPTLTATPDPIHQTNPTT